ncbi:MmgE/PrpD family protein [Brevibacillus reuszeri]|uniref:MmgE/PrpD family protein n=1 Tax=Brevibacillus reuszeri TaxID=54915 RepID=UPI00366B2222
MSITRFTDLLDVLLDKQLADIPADTVQRATWMIADTLFAASFGFQSPELKAYLQKAGIATKDEVNAIPLLGTGLYATREQAAMLYGTAIVSNELDEGNQFAKGHPAAHMLAPALITALAQKAPGAEMIRAFVIGYEVASRLAYASNMNDDMHPHGTWGIVGGAVAAGLLQKKEKKEITEAALLAASLPIATSWEAAVTGMTVRNLYTGVGSFLALQAWTFQSAGFASSGHVVDHLWGSIMSKGINYELFHQDLWAPPLLSKNYFKLYPSCRFSHSAIDALLPLLNEHKLDAAQIESLHVETYGLAARLDNPDPDNALAAKFSIPFLLSALVHGHSLYDCFSGELFHDASVRELAKRIKVTEDEAMTALLPAKRAARVTIMTRTGAEISSYVDAASGGFDQPFPARELREKFASMLAQWDERTSSQMVEEALLLPKAGDVSEWLERINLQTAKG